MWEIVDSVEKALAVVEPLAVPWGFNSNCGLAWNLFRVY